MGGIESLPQPIPRQRESGTALKSQSCPGIHPIQGV